MKRSIWGGVVAAGALAAAFSIAGPGLSAQAPAAGAAAPAAGRGGGGFGGGGGRGGSLGSIITASDMDKDGCVTRAELVAGFGAAYDKWDTGKTNGLTADQIAQGLTVPAAPAAAPAAAAPAPAAAAAPGGGAGGRGGAGRGQNQTPGTCDMALMMAALPTSAPAKPAQPRKVLVLAHAAGFVHSSIPLAAKTVEAMGNKTGAWSTTITYDAADINAANLKQYDAVFLDSTTGCFLDQAGDPAATNERRQALLDFVRSGKGLAGIHAATDSYHSRCPNDPAPDAAAGGGGGRGGGRGANAAAGAPGGAPAAPAAPTGPSPATLALAQTMVKDGDTNKDQKLSRAEFSSLADKWFTQADAAKAGKIKNGDFTLQLGDVLPSAAPAAAPAARTAADLTPDTEKGSWPEFNKMIGGFFKFHWTDPQAITVKIDDPKSPLTSMFHGQEFLIHDETYTMGAASFSRDNVHVLTSIDYSKMSAADKAKESHPRADHDYALSWIRREGNGRVFYEAHGHSERIYADRPMLEHVLAGIQYALGDLKADDTPSSKLAK